MKHKKAYKEALDRHEQFSGRSHFWGGDMMTSDEIKELHKEYKQDRERLNVIKINDRAEIIVLDDGNGYLLKSYRTIVCGYIFGKFYKLWEGYSATTMKHINEFCEAFKLPKFDKYSWVLLATTWGDIVSDETGEVLETWDIVSMA